MFSLNISKKIYQNALSGYQKTGAEINGPGLRGIGSYFLYLFYPFFKDPIIVVLFLCFKMIKP